MKKNTGTPRSIDEAGGQAYNRLGKSFWLVSQRKISFWKSLALITFFGGFIAATAWFVSYRLEQDAFVIETSQFSFAKSDKQNVPKGGAVGRSEEHILVKFKSNVGQEKKQEILSKLQLKEKSEIKAIGVKLVNIPPGKSPEEIVTKLKDEEKASVEFAEVDALLEPSFTPNDPKIGSEWHIAKMRVPTAWDTGKGSGVTVAVLDTGVNCSHQDLSANCVSGWNVVDNNTSTGDIYGHGTLVAGTVAAVGENSVGVAGVSYQSKIMPVRITNDSSTGVAYFSAIASGVTWAADHGARVVTNSYMSSTSSSVQSAATYLRNKGGLFFAAAGNESALITYANPSSVITVGATDSSDNKASWSNYGPAIDVTAPGVSILTTTSSGSYANASGTSFATPNAAANAALLWSVKPGLSPSQLENIMESTAVDLGTAGRDDKYGFGRLDTAAAMAALGSNQVDTTPPSAPTNLSGSATSSSISLSWNASTDNVGVAQYLILRDDSQIGTSTNTSYTDNRISAGSTYTYTVKAADTSGNVSNSSNTVSVTVPVPEISFSISNLSAKSNSTTEATLSWTTNKPATGVVRYGTSKNNLNLSTDVGTVSSTFTVNLTGLTKKTRYYYQVTATSEDGETATSAVLNFMTRPK